MPVEKSAGAVVFHRGPEGKIEYLILKGSKGGKNWTLPKGLIEEKEDLKMTAFREVEEETGLNQKDLLFIDGFKETARYFLKAKYDYQLRVGIKPGQIILKFATYFLMESKTKEARISFEHEDYEWLNFDEAYARMKGGPFREILKKADEFLGMQKV